MTLLPNSYGSVDKVAALTGMWTRGGEFFDATVSVAATQPPLTDVETWIDQLSAILNIALAEEGFVIPVTQDDAVLAIEAMLMPLVADLVQYANQAGRFYTERALQSSTTPLQKITNEIAAWVNMSVGGLEALGASKNASPSGEFGFRDVDERGNETFPIFQRDSFGNKFDNADSAD